MGIAVLVIRRSSNPTRFPETCLPTYGPIPAFSGLHNEQRPARHAKVNFTQHQGLTLRTSWQNIARFLKSKPDVVIDKPSHVILGSET
jgi:hypothetical protein